MIDILICTFLWTYCRIRRVDCELNLKHFYFVVTLFCIALALLWYPVEKINQMDIVLYCVCLASQQYKIKVTWVFLRASSLRSKLNSYIHIIDWKQSIPNITWFLHGKMNCFESTLRSCNSCRLNVCVSHVYSVSSLEPGRPVVTVDDSSPGDWSYSLMTSLRASWAAVSSRLTTSCPWSKFPPNAFEKCCFLVGRHNYLSFPESNQVYISLQVCFYLKSLLFTSSDHKNHIFSSKVFTIYNLDISPSPLTKH